MDDSPFLSGEWAWLQQDRPGKSKLAEIVQQRGQANTSDLLSRHLKYAGGCLRGPNQARAMRNDVLLPGRQ